MSKEEAAEAKYIKMTTKPVAGLVSKLALPSIFSVLITNIYNMADTMFVGRLSTQATAAVGVVFAYMALIQALAFFFGHGAGNFISRVLGARDEEGAAHMAAHGFFSCFIAGTIIGILSLILMTPLMYFLGATDTILPDAKSYFLYIAIATPFLMTSLFLNNLMRFQGNAFFAMFGIGLGAILNIGLDPLFINVFGMGVAGAGLATLISQVISWVFLLFLSTRKDGIRIRFSYYKPTWKETIEIFRGGVPSLGRQGLMSVASICLNNAAKGLPIDPLAIDSAIAAFSVVSRATNFASSVVIGYGQGFQPVCGFNYGAKKFDRVAKSFWFCVVVSTIYCAIVSAFGYIFAENIIKIFRAEDPELVRIGALALRFNCFSFTVIGFVMLANMYLQTINKTIPATVVAMAQMVADACSLVLAIPFTIYALKHMGAPAKEEHENVVSE